MPSESPKGPRSIGRYDIISKIADGGMGSVYKARNQVTGEIVAIKIVPPNMANNQVLIKRFEQEFRAASRIENENLVRALDFGYENNTPYLVMEYVEGETLGQRIERQGRLPEKDAIKIIGQIAKGLHSAHQLGLVHRDVKPDNILITPDGRAKLADMGLVKEVETELNLTRTGRGLGTPQFMAPEQFRNAKHADARCDIYSLGATLYMAVSGELPFRSCSPLDAWMKKVQNDFPPPKELAPHISERLDWAIRRSMSADPQQRPATCREFIEDIMGRSTKKLASPIANGAGQDVWYIVYSDEFGTMHTVKGSLAAIRRCLKEGRLGDAENIKVGRSQTGPFEALKNQPEFRDLVVVPAALPVPAKEGRASQRSMELPPQSSPSYGVTAPQPSSAPVIAPSPSKPISPAVVVASPNEPYGLRQSAIQVAQHQPQPSSSSDWLTWVLLLLVLACGFAIGLLFLLLTK
jgi:serine/threonine protein kinase